ncbi:MAG TPA: hypothetical protein VGX25_22065 [Actinophytocola sp.]|uniref:hypothetical protein n=1 Tax=Actinophytocola sp. TaxID=1872138 RepID=UPI002DDCDB40|nr:hypothetical protein [Actinophytocola sp.]HEV2782086.1 hypothetical protein [Actinophytocola sp.]
MTPPRVTFNDEEMTLTLTGIGAGWTFEQLGELRLFDEAQVQFPSNWDEFQIGVATQVVQSNWRLRSTTFLEQSLQAGISYSLADGGSGQMSADTQLIEHLLRRPLISMDGIFTIKLNGEASAQGFSGDFYIGLGIRGQF